MYRYNPFTGNLDLDTKGGTSTDSSNSVLEDFPCVAEVYVGAAVALTASGLAVNAIATDEDLSNVVGIVESKSSSTLCNIRVTGITEANFAGLDEQKTYFLSEVTAGLLTTTVATSSGSYIAAVAKSVNTTQMSVNIQLRIERA